MEVHGDVVVLRGEALRVVQTAVLSHYRRLRGNGVLPHPLLRDIAAAVTAATCEKSAGGHVFDVARGDARDCDLQGTTMPDADFVGVADLARLLKITPRHARRLASGDPAAVRLGGVWALPRKRAEEIRKIREGNQHHG